MKAKGKAADDRLRRERERRIRLSIGLLCVALSAFAVVPFFFMGGEPPESGWTLRMPTTHDMYLQFDQMRSFYNGLAAGEVYPRWEEDTNRGFGAPTTSYYPPGVYYLTAGLYAIVRDWTRVLLDAQLIMMIASAAALYWCARAVMPRAGATVAMAAYIVSPYHIIDQYQRGALAELTGFVWMPLMLVFAERLFGNRIEAPGVSSKEKAPAVIGGSGKGRVGQRDRTRIYVASLAAVYGAFMWSHPPTAYQFTLIFVFLVVVVAWRRKDWKSLLAICCAIAIGGGLAAAYIYPAATEGGLIRPSFFSEKWSYHVGYVFLHAQPYADAFGDFFRIIDNIWVIGTIAIVIGGVASLWWKPRAEGPSDRVAIWLAAGCLASFMMTQASAPFGRMIPRIEVGIFPWRMLGITTLVTALLAGASAETALSAFKARRTAGWIAFGALAALITVGGAVFSVFKIAAPMANVEVFEAEPEHINFAMVPISAPEDPTKLPEIDRAVLGANNGKVSIEEWKPEHRSIRVELDLPDRLQIRTFNFPGWTASVDNLPAGILTGPSLGNIELELPPGIHQVQLDFRDTSSRRVGSTLTVLSLIALLALLVVWARP